jgi:outer membrane lipoprotein SlyB
MTEHRTIERETIKEEGTRGIPHGDEEVGGAVTGGVVGAVVGAVVGGPVGAVVGGAIGAASGAAAGAVDQKDKDDTVVVTPEVQRP